MTIDPYDYCPCGLDKKIKFCCGAGVAQELEKVERSAEGDQRVAALDQANRAIEKHGPKGCLLDAKAQLQLQLSDLEGAEATVRELLNVVPDSPNGHALRALTLCRSRDFSDVVDAFQAAVEHMKVPTMVVGDVAKALGDFLMESGYVLSAQVHYRIAVAVAAQTNDEELKNDAIGRLLQSSSSPMIHLLWNGLPAWKSAPEGAPYARTFADIDGLFADGKVRLVRQRLEKLLEVYPESAHLWWVYGICEAVMTREQQAAAAWMRYAASPEVDRDEAVMMLARCSLMMDDPGALIDTMRIVYPVRDMEGLLSRLAKEKRVINITNRLKLDQMHPRPKMVYQLLDKVIPPAGESLTLDAVPEGVGTMMLFGKQTDRDARVELMLDKTDDFWLKTTDAVAVMGECVGPASEEKVVGQDLRPALPTRGLFMPPDVPPETQLRLVREEVQQTILDRWPGYTHPLLDGKRPLDVAGDPAYEKRLEALVIALEATAVRSSPEIDFGPLREKLQLPARSLHSLAPGEKPPTGYLSRWVDETAITDDQLKRLFASAVMIGYFPVGLRALNEFERRQWPDVPRSPVGMFLSLLGVCPDTMQSMDLVERAKAYAQNNRSELGRCLVAQLELNLLMGNADAFARTLYELEQRYGKDSEIMPMVVNVLMRYQIMSPDGTMRVPASAADTPAPPASAPPAASPAGGLWTPEGAPVPDSQEPKPKIWVPGMD